MTAHVGKVDQGIDDEPARCLVLFFMHFIGVLITFWSLSDMRTFAPGIDETWLWYANTMLWCLLAFAAVLLVLSRTGPMMFRCVGLQDIADSRPVGCLSLEMYLLALALADFLIIGLLIYGTGGVAQSMYLPFLLAMVPVFTIAGASPRTVPILCMLTLLMFAVLNHWTGYLLKITTFEIDKGRQTEFEKRAIAIIFICALFPMVLALLNERASRRRKSQSVTEAVTAAPST